jgi:hypothetical protein
MNRKLLIIGAVVLLAIIFVSAKLLFFSSPEADRDVLKFVKQMNSHCPSMVDNETRLDKVQFLPGNNLEFYYTLIQRDKDSVSINNLKQFMGPVILNKIKSSPTLNRYISKNLTWVYSYNDKNGDFVFKITFTPEQFK